MLRKREWIVPGVVAFGFASLLVLRSMFGPRSPSRPDLVQRIEDEPSANSIVVSAPAPRVEQQSQRVVQAPRIQGRVISEAGAGIGGVVLAALGSNARGTTPALSRLDGTFELLLFEVAEPATIFAWKDGYSSEWVPSDLATRAANELVIVMRAPAKLTIRLQDWFGTSVVNQRVFAWSNRRPRGISVMFPEFYSSGLSDDGGEVLLGELPYGPVHIAIAHDFSEWMHSCRSYRELSTIVVSAPEHRLEIEVPRGSALIGEIALAGLPSNTAVGLSLRNKKSELVATQQTHARGSFEWQRIPRGIYDLELAVNESAACHFRVSMRDNDEDLGTLECDTRVEKREK